MRWTWSIEQPVRVVLVSLALGAVAPHAVASERVFHDRLRDGSQGPALVEIAAGQFRMGSAPGEVLHDPGESPQRTVAVERFAIGRTEVTRGEYRRFVDATGYVSDAERNVNSPGCYAYLGATTFRWDRRLSWRQVSFPQDDAHPVVCVSWRDAIAYVRWLAAETGQAYRLPSEAEFEYVNRAGATTPWPWGDEPSGGCRVANYGDRRQARVATGWSFPTADCDDGHAFTAASGSLAPNAWGVHDISGNVWEWTADCWNPDHTGAPGDARARTTGDCEKRVLKGGAWSNKPQWLRSADRGANHVTYRTTLHGFRVARAL